MTREQGIQRLRSAVHMHDVENLTWAEMGVRLGVTKGRAKDIYRSGKFWEEQQGDKSNALVGLSVRAANCLNNIGLETRDQVMEAVRTGRLKPKGIRGFGRVTFMEICEWLEIPVPKYCPTCGRCTHPVPIRIT